MSDAIIERHDLDLICGFAVISALWDLTKNWISYAINKIFMLSACSHFCWHKSVYLGKVSFLKTTLCLREQDYITSTYFGINWTSSNYHFSNPSPIHLIAYEVYEPINSTNWWLHNEPSFVVIESQMNISFNEQVKRGSDIMPKSANQRFKLPGEKTLLLMFYLILPFHHYAFLFRLV